LEHTLKDLEEARKELANWQQRRSDDDSNNPNKYRGQINAAWYRVRLIESVLKYSGVIELVPEEKLQNELDRLHPNARSRSIVKYNGKKYQIRYSPLSISRSGKTVTEWGHEWIPLKENRK